MNLSVTIRYYDKNILFVEKWEFLFLKMGNTGESQQWLESSDNHQVKNISISILLKEECYQGVKQG